jgi:hypothetical protein
MLMPPASLQDKLMRLSSRRIVKRQVSISREQHELIQIRQLEQLSPDSQLDRLTNLRRCLSVKTRSVASFTRAASELVGEWWVVEELGSMLLQLDDPAHVARVLDSAQCLEHADLQSRLVSFVVSRFADRGHVGAAMNASEAVSLPPFRARIVCETAIALAQNGRFRRRSTIDCAHRGRRGARPC